MLIMKARIISLCFLIAILLPGCGRASLDMELALCGSYAVPGMPLHDLKGGTFTCNILEKDSYGRILYEYTAENIITGQAQTALVICQKIDGDYVYFYEDYCYLLGDYTEEQIDYLKVRNDWGYALNEKLCSRRKNAISFDLYIVTDANYWGSELDDIFSRSFSVESDQIKDYCLLDEDSSGNALFWVIISEDGMDTPYFAIVDPSGNAAVMKITADAPYWKELTSFKQAQGWVYGS